MSARLKIAAALVACICPLSLVYSQEGVDEALLLRLGDHLDRLDALVQDPSPEVLSLDGNEGISLFSIQTPEAGGQIFDALGGVTNALKDEINTRTGLVFQPNFYYRVGDAASVEADDYAEEGYRAKASVELGWSFFNSSLFLKSRGYDKEYEIQESIEREKYNKEFRSILLTEKKERLKKDYDLLLAQVLLHHSRNLSLLDSVASYLIGITNVSSDMMLETIKEMASVERRLAEIPDSENMEPAESLSNILCLTAVIDTASLYEEIRRVHSDARLMALNLELVEKQLQNTTYLTRDGFEAQTFVRYAYYMRTYFNRNTSNLDMGLQLRFPLSGEVGAKRRTLSAKGELIQAEREAFETQVSESAARVVAEIERYNRMAEVECRGLQNLKQYLKQRSYAFNNVAGKYDMLTRATEYNLYFQTWERLLEVWYARDCLILDLQLFLAGTPVGNYCRMVETIVT